MGMINIRLIIAIPLSNWGRGAQFYNESDVFNYSLVIVLFCTSFVLKKSGKISFGFALLSIYPHAHLLFVAFTLAEATI